MVKIKSIAIQGFKSFGSKRTVIKFPLGLTVITGPNGGGKSTVLDAIKFALGELSAHNLRADRFSKLLHESSKGQDQYAMVSLTLDNSAHTLPVDSDEAVLTRRLFSTGESEYLVNGKTVSRNEMLTILSASNIKPDGLNLVTQGSVVGIAEMTSRELRQVLEDAAGISGYKKRRDEALKELETAQKNLDVAKAATSEVRNRVKQLELERNQYLRKTLVDRELGRLKSVALVNEVKKTRLALAQLESRASELVNSLAEKQKHIEETVEKSSIIRKEVESLQHLGEQLNTQLRAIERQKYDKESEKNRLKAEINSYEISLQQTAEHRKTLLENVQDWRERLAALEARLKEKEAEAEKAYENYRSAEEQLNSLRAEVEKVRASLDNVEDNYSSKLDELKYLKLTDDGRSLLLESLEKQIASKKSEQEELLKQFEYLRSKRLDLEVELEKCKNAVAELSSTLETFEKQAEAIKAALTSEKSKLDEADRMLDELRLLKSSISQLLETLRKEDDGRKDGRTVKTLGEFFGQNLNPAFKAVLGDWVNAILVEDVENAFTLAARAAELGLPLKIVPVDDSSLEPEKIIERVTGSPPPRLVESVKQLHPTEKNVATYDGVYVSQNHTVIVVGDSGKTRLYTRLENSLNKLDTLEKRLSSSKSVIQSKLSSLEESLRQTAQKSEVVKKELNERRVEHARVEERLREVEKTTESLKNRIASLEKSLQSLEDEREKLRSTVAEKSDELASLTALRKEMERLRRELREAEEKLRKQSTNASNLYKTYLNVEKEKDSLHLEIRNTVERIENAGRELAVLSTREEKLAAMLESKMNELAKVEQELARMSEDEKTLEMELGSLKERLNEKNNVLKQVEEGLQRLRDEAAALERENSSLMVERVRLETSLKALNERLQALSTTADEEVTRLPHDLLPSLEEESAEISVVNQLAVMQYDSIISNYKLRSTRINELEMERKRILDLIESINREEVEAFGKALEKVSDSFNFYFNQLTGGEGFLRLENPEDPLNSGVEMVVRFVGKQARSTSSVSGGEKSVSAVALILALQDLTPAQFYVFDEIDAHLDVVYVKNLVNLLKKMSSKKQIVIITLKDIIAEQADALFGVYMVNETSHVVKTKLSEVVEAG
ncbi:MAG: chromosome segregation SMC family protein [Candidatus Caldarchaeum sp.]